MAWGSGPGNAPSTIGQHTDFPKDAATKEPHLATPRSHQAGMTHTARGADRPGSKAHKQEVAEDVATLEASLPIVAGLPGCDETPCDPQALISVWAGRFSEERKRRFYKTWHKSGKRTPRREALLPRRAVPSWAGAGTYLSLPSATRAFAARRARIKVLSCHCPAAFWG